VPSPALSIIRNGPDSFAGRKVGALVTDGADGALLDALRAALEEEGAMLELVAPTVGGIVTGTRDRIPGRVLGGSGRPEPPWVCRRL